MDDPEPPGTHLLVAAFVTHGVVFSVALLVVTLAVIAATAVRNFRWTRLERLLDTGPTTDRVRAFLRDERRLLDSLRIVRVLAALVLLATLMGGLPFARDSYLDQNAFVRLLGTGALILLLVHGLVKGVAREAPERSLLFLLPLLPAVTRAVAPLRWIIDRTAAVFARALGIQREDEEEAQEAREDVLDAVSEGENEGALDDEEREMIESIIEFRDQEVSEVMTPRTSVFGIAVDTPIDEAVAQVIQQGHSRIPVYGESLDDIKGVLYAKDLLTLWADRTGTMPTLASLLRKPTYIPETKNTLELLRQLRSEKVHLAIVLDEYGGMSGLVTIEDILEEIVGEIEDEYDRGNPEATAGITLIGERTAEMSGRVRIDEVNEALDLELPGEDGYDTIGGFLFSKLGRVPEPGETFAFEKARFEVTEADDRRIHRVTVTVAD